MVVEAGRPQALDPTAGLSGRRITFRFEDGDAYEVDLVDYH